MIFTPTAIAGATIIDLEPRRDERGWFARAFCKRELEGAGIRFDCAQSNLAFSHRAGVIRGLHYVAAPAAEAKLVRCVAGAILDALVDMREDSPSYRVAFWLQLDAMAQRSLYIPSGVAHGYQALHDETLVLYMTDHYFVPGIERGIRFDDPSCAIPWPLPPRELAARDLAWPPRGGLPGP